MWIHFRMLMDLADIQELAFSDRSLVLVKPPDKCYAVVGFDRKGFVCHWCNFGKHSCCHINCIQDHLKHREQNVPDFLLDMQTAQSELQHSKIVSRSPKHFSHGKISWSTTPQQKTIYSLSSHTVQSVLPDGTISLIPSDVACPECNSNLSVLVQHELSAKRLLLWANVILVTVFTRRCENCGHERFYCGSSDGILNMGSFLVGHDVLRDYLNLFLTGNSCSLIGFFEKWKLNYEAAGCAGDEMISYHQLPFAWYAYMSLLDIDYANGFKCDLCGQFPDFLTCDATTLGFKRIFAPSQLRFFGHGTENVLHGSFVVRTLLTNKELRLLLQNYANRKEMETQASERMRHLLKEHYKPLASFVHLCEITFERADLIPPSIMQFLKCMSSFSPVCSYFPSSPTFLSLINEIKSGLRIRKHPQKLQEFQHLAPILFNAFLDLPDGIPPVELLDLFNALERKVNDTFVQEPHILNNVSQDQFTAPSFSYLPNWPVLNCRGVYRQDSIGSKKQVVDCNKDYRGHPTLMPGIFTLYCKHDICYGFDVMESQASPNVPFTIFRTRFPKAPNTIVYDNSCNLQSYCLNRDPGFYKETLFLVDRFHWKNHKACAASYHLSMFSQYAGVNSQINEQRNARLKRVKGQLSYMNPTNFVNSCRLLLWYCNVKAKSNT